MKHTFFAFINRMKLISRWGLMRSRTGEDVAQHSHMTAVLAHALGLIDREIFGMPTDPDRAAVLALYHETAEVLTGDMPTPVKYRSPEMTEAFKTAEQDAEQQILKLLPDVLKTSMESVVRPVPCRESQIVKFADKIAGYVKCVEEFSAGNQEFAPAKRAHESAIKAYQDPTVDYFMKSFAESFSMNLDELL